MDTEDTESKGGSLFVRVNAPEGEEATGWGLFSAPVERADGDGLTMVLASEPVEDRMGDIVAPPWQLGNFRRNPVILFGHASWEPPVGRGEKIKLSEGKLTVGIKWDDHESNPMGRLMAHQYRAGFMNAVSVGFRSRKITHRSKLDEDHEHRGDRGYLLQRNELLELSAVPIPALQTALAQRGDAAPATFREAVQWFHKGMVDQAAEAVLERSPDPLTADKVIEAIKADPTLLAGLSAALGLPELTESVRSLQSPPHGGGLFVPPRA